MDRSLFPEGVEVHQVDLERTETTKAFHIINRHLNVSFNGLLSGGQVTVNGSNQTKVDAAAFNAYVASGEFVESDTALTLLSLSDYTLGAINYVIGFYSETNTKLEPHETNGNSYATEADRSVRIKVLSAAEYAGLPTTSEDMSVDTVDRSVILGIITANGANVVLTNSNITNVSEFNSAINAVNSTGTVTGVSIMSIDRTTSTGSGFISFTMVGSDKYLSWQAPDDGTPGATVLVNTSGVYTLASSPSGKTITVLVNAANLPGAGPLTDTVVVSNIYDQSLLARFTGEDLQHRSMMGSGTPTITNPHGLTLDDLGVSAGTVEIHQDLFHSNGILRDSSTTCLLAYVDNSTSPDRLLVNMPIGADSFYMNGVEHNTLSSNVVTFTDLGLPDLQLLFNIYAKEGTNKIATLEKWERVRYDSISPPTLSQPVQLYDISENVPPGAINIQYSSSAFTLAFKLGSDTNYGAAEPIPTGGTGSVLRLYSYYRNYWIEVFVAPTFSTRWSGVGTVVVNLTVAALPTAIELEERLKIASVMYSGSSTGYLGVGFSDLANSPNYIKDQRQRGMTGVRDLRDDVDETYSITDICNSNPPTNLDAIQRTQAYVTVGTGGRYSQGMFNVCDYIDDRTCIEAAIAWLTTRGGGTLWFKPGLYTINKNATITIPSNVSIRGEAGATASRAVTIRKIDTSAYPIFVIDATAREARISNIRFELQAITNYQLLTINGSDTHIDDCQFASSTNQTVYAPLIKIDSASNAIRDTHITRCIFNLDGNLVAGIDVSANSTYNIRHTRMQGCSFSGASTLEAVRLFGATNTQVIDCDFNLTGTAGCLYSTTGTGGMYCNGLQIKGCNFENCIAVIDCNALRDTIITDNRFDSCGTATTSVLTFRNTTTATYNVIIKGNVFTGTGSALYHIISVSTNAIYNAIIDSNVFTQVCVNSSVCVQNCCRLKISNNIFDTIGVNPISVSGAGSYEYAVDNNIIYEATNATAIYTEGRINSISGNIIDALGVGIHKMWNGINPVPTSDRQNGVVSNNIIINTTMADTAGGSLLLQSGTSDNVMGDRFTNTICGNIIIPTSAHCMRIAVEKPLSYASGIIYGELTVANNIMIPVSAGDGIVAADDLAYATDCYLYGPNMFTGNIIKAIGHGVYASKRGVSHILDNTFATGNYVNCDGDGLDGFDYVVGNKVEFGETATTSTGVRCSGSSSIIVGNYINQTGTPAGTTSRTGVYNGGTAIGNRIGCGGGLTNGSATGILQGSGSANIAIGNTCSPIGNNMSAGGTAAAISNLSSANSPQVIMGNNFGTIGMTGVTWAIGFNAAPNAGRTTIIGNLGGNIVGTNRATILGNGLSDHDTVLCFNAQYSNGCPIWSGYTGSELFPRQNTNTEVATSTPDIAGWGSGVANRYASEF
jgi:hypothetical protein